MASLKVSRGKDGRPMTVISSDDLPLHKFDILKKHNMLSCEKLLTLTIYDLVEKTGLNLDDVNDILKIASTKLSPPILPIKDSVKSQVGLSFGSPNLDQAFLPLLYPGTILELWGEAASGKTQLALQLCASLHPNFSSAYISTEGPIPSGRLMELHRCRTNSPTSTPKCEVQQCTTLEALTDCIYRQLPLLASSSPLKLVILDSVAAPFRCAEVEGGGVRRAQVIRSLGQQLKYLAVNHDLVVVTVNQATSVPEVGLAPALGLTWSYVVNARLRLVDVGESGRRVVTVDKSSVLKTGTSSVTCSLKNTGII